MGESIIEEWIAIEGFEGRYEISSMGRVKSVRRYVKNGKGQRVVPENIIYQDTLRTGYCQVHLYKDGRSYAKAVHRLVAMAFMAPVDGKPYINHIDGDKTNNRVDNLEWCTNNENQLHAIKIGAFWHTGEAHPRARPVMQLKDGARVKVWNCINDAVRNLGISQSNIVACCTGRRKTAGGFQWNYL